MANSFVFKEPVSTTRRLSLPGRVERAQHGADPAEVRGILLAAANDLVGDYTREATAKWKEVVQRYLIEDAQPSRW